MPRTLRRTHRPPTLIEQEHEAEGDVPVTVRVEDAPLDFGSRFRNGWFGVPGERWIDVRRADGAHGRRAGGYEQCTHDGRNHSDTQ